MTLVSAMGAYWKEYGAINSSLSPHPLQAWLLYSTESTNTWVEVEVEASFQVGPLPDKGGTLKGVLHPRPVFGLFLHFSQKLQHIGNK